MKTKQKRLKRIILEDTACYHVLSRIIERRFYLSSHEKNMFCDMMRRVAAFSGVNILTFCIMDNHFHLLIQIPKRVELSFDDVVARLPHIYRNDDLAEIYAEIAHWKKQNNNAMLNELKLRYERRMYNLSEFMKTLKQRFSIWYNRNHNDRKGTLWEDRFKSVLVESPNTNGTDIGNRAILTMAAYIELNSVRASLVDDPKDYHWCGYAEAVAGIQEARNGIGFLAGYLSNTIVDWRNASKAYRIQLFMRGRYHNTINRDKIKRVLDEGGQLSQSDLLRCRVRYFTDGLVFGHSAFIEDVFHRKRACFHAHRRSGARKMQGGNWDGLYSARDLQRKVITVPNV